jgi:hypothetical protein
VGYTLLAATFLAHTARSAAVEESFSTDPAANGWQVHGEQALFSWDSANEVLRVTWDSSKTNSYFYLPLPSVLTRNESFQASFDLMLDDITAGTTAGKPDTFPIAVCLFNIEAAKRTNFFIGAGTSSSLGPRSTVEFNYFPASGAIAATFSAIAVPTNTNPFLYHHDFPRVLDTGIWHRITLDYNGSNQTVTVTKTRAGAPFGLVQSIPLTSGFGDFRINTLAISSYSDKVGLGSLLAHGVIDNISVTLPEPPIATVVLTLTNGPQVHFQSRSGWNYFLERSPDTGDWSAASAGLPGNGGWLTLSDTNAPAPQAYYRVRAEQP